MSLPSDVLRTMRRHGMLRRGGSVLAACSGGPDSVALVHILLELQARGELVLAGLAHFNHQLRAAANEDEAFCRRLAADLSLVLEVGRANVQAAARQQKRSVEDTARRLRYGFLEEAAVRQNADAIAVGHSRDDQAETFLLRLLRGAGTRGLGAIRPKAGRVIRPLLESPRAALRRFAAERGLPFREDETNEDLRIPRNRVRHELLPYLRAAFSPNIDQLLAHEAAAAQIDEDRLQLEAIDLAASIVLTDTSGQSGSPVSGLADVASSGLSADNRIVIDAVGLTGLHPALATRVARHALSIRARDRFIGFEHVFGLLELARAGKPGSALSLPGQQARVEGTRVVLGPEPVRESADLEAEGRKRTHSAIPLSIPGEVILGPQRMAVTASWAVDGHPGGADIASGWLVKGVRGPLGIRTRRPGDRFKPQGLKGRTRKLQDYFVDRKVERSGRDLVPLVVDADDRIVCVVGHGVSEEFRASEPSPGVILLKARRLGGEV